MAHSRKQTNHRILGQTEQISNGIMHLLARCETDAYKQTAGTMFLLKQTALLSLLS